MPALMILLAALAMSVGWGFRGNYGHEAGAMVPGALLGLAISLTSRRPDWQARGVTLAFLGALGWAFGGQMSYAKIIGYTCHTSFRDVYYGYNCLFLIGGMWGGMGAGILALALTESTETLDRWCLPLIIVWAVWQLVDFTGLTAKLEANAWLHSPTRAWWLKDADWIAALAALVAAGITGLFVPRSRSQAACIALLAGGWLIAFLLLVGVFHLHMTPPRGDNWAGCVGLFIAFCAYLIWQKNRAAIYLLVWGFFAGGLGFAIADLPQVLGRASWGTIGRWALRYHLDYWKWMEQGFGLFMGAVVAVGVLRLARGRLAPPAELTSKKFDFMSLVYLLVVMMWENLHKNLKNWNKADLLPKALGNRKSLVVHNRWRVALGRGHYRTLPPGHGPYPAYAPGSAGPQPLALPVDSVDRAGRRLRTSFSFVEKSRTPFRRNDFLVDGRDLLADCRRAPGRFCFCGGNPAGDRLILENALGAVGRLGVGAGGSLWVDVVFGSLAQLASSG